MKIASIVTLFTVVFIFANSGILCAQNNISTNDQELTVKLTPEEQAWLEEHPEIVLGYTGAFEPDVIVNPDGSLRGIQVDLLNELNRRLGTRIGLKIYPIPELIEKAQKREVDGIINLHPEYADKLGLLKTRPNFINYPAVFSRRDISFNNPSDLFGKRVAIIDQVFFSEKIIEQHGKGATILKVQDAEEGLQLIDNGQADYFLGATLNAFLISKYQLFNLSTQYVFYNYPIHGVIGTRPDWPELSSILDKGLSSFSRYEFESIMAKWSHLPEQPMGLPLSDEENAWLAQNYTVQVRVVDHPPLVILDEGQPRGISIDYLEYIARYTGINFQYIEEIRPFNQAYQSMKNLQGPDLIQSSQVKAEQMGEDLFSKVYFAAPYVIYMRNNADFISGIEGLAGKTIAIPGDSLLYKQLLAQVSDSQLVQFDSDYDALIAVSTGKTDAYIGNLTEVSYYIQEHNINNLKIAAPSLLKDEAFSFGIRPDWPELATLINKVLDNISSENRSAIRNKYVAIQFHHGIDIAEVRTWGGVGLLVALSIIILVLFWNRSLQKLVAIRTTTLTESEKRFRATFEQAAVGIAHVSLEGYFLRINQRFCDIVGYTSDEMLELTFKAITHPDDLDADVAEVQRLLDGEKTTYSMEKRYIHKDNHPVWIKLTVSLVCDEADVPAWFVAVVTDISERKQAENALKESEERFRSLVEQSPVSIQIHSPDGKIIGANKAFAEIYGLSEEALEEVYEKFNVLKDEQLKEKGLMSFLEKPFQGETVVLPPYEYDGVDTLRTLDFEKPIARKCWVQTMGFPMLDAEGKVKSVVFMCEDITERKQAEEKIDEIRNYTDHLIQTANVMIVSLDNQGQVQHFNPAAEKITGYTLANIKGKSWFKLLTPPDRYPKVHEEFDRIMKGGLPKTYENPILTKSGEERFISWTNSEIKQENEITGITSFGIDITKRRQAELELAESREALRDSEEKFRNLMEQSPVSIQIHNPDGKLLQSNAAYARLYALNEQILEELYEKYNVLEDEQARTLGIMPYIEKVFAGEDAIFTDYIYDGVDTLKTLDFKNPVSRKVWIQTHGYAVKNKDGKIINAVFMSEDITDRKLAEEALRESEEKYRVLVEQAQDGITIVRDGKILFINPYLAKLQGYTESEIIGTPFTDHISPDEIDKVREIYQLRMAGKPAPMVYESALKSKDGLRVEVEFNAAVIIYDGKPADLVIVRNISERKQVEWELNQYRGRLQSLAAELTLTEEKERRRIATDLHDQIGQILASTRFQLAAMQKTIVDPSLSEKLSKVSGNLRQAVDDTRHIISDLSSPLLDELGFEAAISEWLEENVQNRFDIKTSLSSNTKKIDLQENVGIMLYRSVRELLTNVIKHARATKVDVIIDAQDETLNLTVRDDGIGFNYDPKQYSVKGAKSLGLFSIRERMSDLGGEMTVKSSKSKGTEVTLIAPLSRK